MPPAYVKPYVKRRTDLVSRRVNVISALGGPSSALAAKGATSTTPIVTSFSADTAGPAGRGDESHHHHRRGVVAVLCLWWWLG
jgi:hypothetical protein